MAVYTKVSLAEAKIALTAYDLGTITACDEIASGVENSNFFITTQDKRFVMTLYEKRVNEADIPYFLSLMEHLHNKGFPCPEPIADKDGKILQKINNRTAALFSFLPGQSLTPDAVKPNHCGAVATYLAQLHLATADFTSVRPNNLSHHGWMELSDQAAMHADRVRPGMAQRLNMELNYIRNYWNDDVPHGTCHADLFPDNIFFDGDNLCGVIDFYFACTDALAYDLAIAMNAWCFIKGQFLPEHCKAFLQAYDKVRPLTDEERKALPLFARGAALRFLLTRLVDWVNHDDAALVIPHDPMDFYSILSFHQNINDCSEYGI